MAKLTSAKLSIGWCPDLRDPDAPTLYAGNLQLTVIPPAEDVDNISQDVFDSFPQHVHDALARTFEHSNIVIGAPGENLSSGAPKEGVWLSELPPGTLFRWAGFSTLPLMIKLGDDVSEYHGPFVVNLASLNGFTAEDAEVEQPTPLTAVLTACLIRAALWIGAWRHRRIK